MIDGIGISGIVTQFAVAIGLSCTAAVFFIYFYSKGAASFDEEANLQMLVDDGMKEKDQ